MTDDQRAAIEHLEREAHCCAPAAEVLLKFAREYIEASLVDMAYCDVAAPSGATWVDGWQPHIDFGDCRAVTWREFNGVFYELYGKKAEGSVVIDGWQRCDGSVVRGISVYREDCATFTSAQARQLAAVLMSAADELDRLQ